MTRNRLQRNEQNDRAEFIMDDIPEMKISLKLNSLDC